MSNFKARLKKLEGVSNPDQYRERNFIAFEDRAPLTPLEWTELVDLNELAHQKFEAHIESGKGRLLSASQMDALYEEYEGTGDFGKLEAVLSDPNTHVDDSEAWNFLEGADARRAFELINKIFRFKVLKDPDLAAMVDDADRERLQQQLNDRMD